MFTLNVSGSRPGCQAMAKGQCIFEMAGLEKVSYSTYHLKNHVTFHKIKTYMSITTFSIVQSFWSFTQNSAVICCCGVGITRGPDY